MERAVGRLDKDRYRRSSRGYALTPTAAAGTVHIVMIC